LVVCLSLVGIACSAGTDEASVEASDTEVNAAAPLLGAYEGTGLFDRLALDRDASGQPFFARPHCEASECGAFPFHDVKAQGRWSVFVTKRSM
jgi:hypothetical protein